MEAEGNLLIKEDLTVLSALSNCLAKAPWTQRICVGALQKPAIPPDNIIQAILCGTIKFWNDCY